VEDTVLLGRHQGVVELPRAAEKSAYVGVDLVEMSPATFSLTFSGILTILSLVAS
jgi:hypothetical protein